MAVTAADVASTITRSVTFNIIQLSYRINNEKKEKNCFQLTGNVTIVDSFTAAAVNDDIQRFFRHFDPEL